MLARARRCGVSLRPVPVYRIPEQLVFPSPDLAEPGGLLGVGGDLRPDRLLLGYANGIFPWYSEGQPILWFSPDPRFVLRPDALHIGRSLAKRIRRGDYRVTLDTAFEQVIAGCREAWRPGQSGTWITEDMEAAYVQLHRLGFAHSVEAWQGDTLVGGLYGVAVGRLYSGESMFARAPDASKVAFVWLANQLRDWGFGLIDCQVYTDHLARFGAEEIPREAYLARVSSLVRLDGRPGAWAFDPGFIPDPLR
jgi:leucyl/phenylalanyl-tRNA--protein transferase